MSSKNTIIFGTYGKALQEILLERNLENKWLAGKLGCGEDQISRYVNNKVTPGKRRRRRIGNLLGVTFNQNEEGKWIVEEKKDVSEAVSSVSEATNESDSYIAQSQDLDEVARSLEFAQKMIHDALKVIDKMKDDR